MTSLFIDVDTQLDFLFPTGALYVAGAERILPAVERLNRYAAAHGIRVLSTADSHAENDPEFAKWPPHCIAGTTGQHKASGTLLEKRAVIPNRECSFALEGAQQVIVEKETVEVFAARNLGGVLEALPADRFVVYGVVTEICVRHAVHGLLRWKKPVVVVSDAVKELRAEDGARTLDEIRALGGAVTTLAEVCRE